tara:strand:- start:315 stop:494 length:180 start_codon:yes stop_codon:yes gene_type:complete
MTTQWSIAQLERTVADGGVTADDEGLYQHELTHVKQWAAVVHTDEVKAAYAAMLEAQEV